MLIHNFQLSKGESLRKRGKCNKNCKLSEVGAGISALGTSGTIVFNRYVRLGSALFICEIPGGGNFITETLVCHRTRPNFRSHRNRFIQAVSSFVTQNLGSTQSKIPPSNSDHLQFLLQLPRFFRDSPLLSPFFLSRSRSTKNVNLFFLELFLFLICTIRRF